MSEDKKHTPLPYRVVNDFHFYLVMFGEIVVCKTDDKDNAEFIVRACNSHYELLEALKLALDYAPNTHLAWCNTAKAAIAKAEAK